VTALEITDSPSIEQMDIGFHRSFFMAGPLFLAHPSRPFLKWFEDSPDVRSKERPKSFVKFFVCGVDVQGTQLIHQFFGHVIGISAGINDILGWVRAQTAKITRLHHGTVLIGFPNKVEGFSFDFLPRDVHRLIILWGKNK